MCMILASPESVFHGNFYALTNTFPVMKQLGIEQGNLIVQYYLKFGSNILTKVSFAIEVRETPSLEAMVR